MTDQQLKAQRLRRLIVASNKATATIDRTITALKALKAKPVEEGWRVRVVAEMADEFARLREMDCSFWRVLRDTAMAHARHLRAGNHLFDMHDALADARRANHLLIEASRREAVRTVASQLDR